MFEIFKNPDFYWFCAGCFFLAWMDIFNFLIGPGSSFWHMRPGNNDNDAFHWSKRAALACFALGIIGLEYSLIFFAIAAYLIQIIIFDVIGKTIWGNENGSA